MTEDGWSLLDALVALALAGALCGIPLLCARNELRALRNIHGALALAELREEALASAEEAIRSFGAENPLGAVVEAERQSGGNVRCAVEPALVTAPVLIAFRCRFRKEPSILIPTTRSALDE